MFGLHDKIRKFFDSAKDLALAVVTRIDGAELPIDHELVSLQRSLADADPVTLEHAIEIRPKRAGYVIGALAFMEDSMVEILSIKPTPSSNGYPADERVAHPLDAAYFCTTHMYCPFDFGWADADHPVVMKIRFTAKARETGKAMLNMIAFVSPNGLADTIPDMASGWQAFREGMERARATDGEPQAH